MAEGFPFDLAPLRDMHRIAEGLGMRLMVVGALARLLVFNRPFGIQAYRTTRDCDLAVRVESWADFHRLRAAALDGAGLFRGSPSLHRLVHVSTGTSVDLLPFGALESDGAIIWADSGQRMDVTAFGDASENAVEVELEPGLSVRVVSLPMLVALKLFAVNDRGATDDRDVRDLWHMVEHYPVAGQEERLLSRPLASLIDGDFNWDTDGAPLLLGYDMGRACGERTRHRLPGILAKLTDPYSRWIAPLVSRIVDDQSELLRRQRIARAFGWLGTGAKVSGDGLPSA